MNKKTIKLLSLFCLFFSTQIHAANSADIVSFFNSCRAQTVHPVDACQKINFYTNQIQYDNQIKPEDAIALFKSITGFLGDYFKQIPTAYSEPIIKTPELLNLETFASRFIITVLSKISWKPLACQNTLFYRSLLQKHLYEHSMYIFSTNFFQKLLLYLDRRLLEYLTSIRKSDSLIRTQIKEAKARFIKQQIEIAKLKLQNATKL